MNLSDIDAYTRDLTGVFSTDVVTSSLMTRFINESYKELARRQGWPWLVAGTVTPLALPTDVPVFDDEFHATLAYRSAVKVLAFVADDTPRAQSYIEEYNSLVKDMETTYLSGYATGVSVTLSNMARMVRDITGVYDDQLINDAMIKIYINRAYHEVAMQRDWDWLETTTTTAMPAYVGGVHLINLANGTRRIQEAYVVEADGYVETMVGVPSLLDIEPTDTIPRYDVTQDGVFTFKPEQSNSASVKIRYLQAFVTMGDGDSPLFDPVFNMILVFRAAISVLAQVSPDDKRTEGFAAEYELLREAMIAHYELDHDTRSMQIGSQGVETRKYFPWFKPL